jgi:small subunit ribosomal protein S18b
MQAAKQAAADVAAQMGLGAPDASASQAAAPHLPAFDLSLDLCTEVAELHVLPPSSPFPLALLLTTGKRVEVDLVVSATGVRPNTAPWADEANFVCSEDGALVVDECLRTSVPDVYAAGDCACLRFSEAFLALNSSPERPLLFHQQRLWAHAKLLGLYAARSLSGLYEAELAELDGFNFMLFAHTSVLLGRKAVLLGLHNLQNLGGPERVRELVRSGALRTLVRCRPERRAELIKLHLLHGRLIGALLLGKMDAADGSVPAHAHSGGCCGGGRGSSGSGGGDVGFLTAEGADALELEETCENLMLNQTDLSEFGDFLNEFDVDLADYFD